MNDSEFFDNEKNESVVKDENTTDIEKKKPKKAKMVFTTGQVVLIVIIAVVVVAFAATGIICAKNDVNPVSYIAGEMTKNKIVAKWQSQSAPGLSAYEFFDDGTYTSYFSTYTFDGEYEIDGDRLTLKNTSSNQSVVYKYSIVGDTLTLSLLSQNGSDFDDSESSKFDRVDSFNMKTIAEMLEDLAEQTTQAETDTNK